MSVRGKYVAVVLLFIAALHFGGGFAHSAPRVAVIAADGDDAANLATLLEINLAQAGDTMVDRAHLDDVLKEQKLQILLSADAPDARAKLGQLLNANFLVFVSCPDKPIRRLEVITCETTQGIRLARATLPRASTIDKDATAANGAVAKAIAKSAKAGLKLVAVAPWSSEDLTTRFDYRRAAFRRLVEAPLADRDDLVLVEFAEAQALQTELAIAGQPNLVRKEPMFLSGKMKHSSVAPDAQVTVDLELRRGDQTLGTWTSGQVDVPAAAEALPAAATDLVNKAAGGNPPIAPKLQGKELADQGAALLKLSFNSDAAEMYEAALLLDPDNTAYHFGAARSLYLEMSRDLELQGPAPDLFDPLAHATRVLAASCRPPAERCLQHMEVVYEHTTMSDYFFVDFDFTGVVARFVPHSEMWDSTYRVMQYKHDHGVDDSFASHTLRQVMDSTIPPWLIPGDDDAAFVTRLTDVCTPGAAIGYGLRRFPDRPMSPQLASILSHMEHSTNPAAVSAAKEYRAYLAKVDDPANFVPHPPRPLPPGPQVVSDFHMVPMKLPIEKSANGFESWANAGPHADLLEQCVADTTPNAPAPYCFESYYLRDDGFVKNLGHFISGPQFDGKYLWWVAVENRVTVVKVYDPNRDKMWTAGAANGVPPDEVIHAAAVGASPGSAYIVAAIGSIALDIDNPPTRTWLAAATMDDVAGPSLKIIHDWREHPMRADVAFKPRAAFSCDTIMLLPGPLGAKKLVPKLYISGGGLRGTCLFSVDPTTGRAGLLDNKYCFRFAGTVFHDKVYGQGRSVFDPATDTVTTLSPVLPASLAGPKPGLSWGPMIWKDKFYYVALDTDVAYIWTYQDGLPTKPIVTKIDHRPYERAFFSIYCTSAFGLVGSMTQLQLFHPEEHPEYQQTNWQTWLQKHNDREHHSDVPKLGMSR